MIYNFKSMFVWLLLLSYCFCVTEIFAQDNDLRPTDVELVDENTFVGPKMNPINKIAPFRDFGLFDYNFNNYGAALWKATAMIVSENAEQTVAGTVTFRQIGPRQPVLVAMNITGLPPGKHAVHIHAFGDLSNGCMSTGPNLQGNMIGNVETKEDGSAAFQFLSPYVQLFGISGIIGRSIVIHEKPSQYPQIYTPVINPPTYPYQAEEDIIGGRIACGIISITSNV